MDDDPRCSLTGGIAEVTDSSRHDEANTKIA
jgi:hypothetical protein